MVGRLISFWDGIFSRAILNFQGVSVEFPFCPSDFNQLIFSLGGGHPSTVVSRVFPQPCDISRSPTGVTSISPSKKRVFSIELGRWTFFFCWRHILKPIKPQAFWTPFCWRWRTRFLFKLVLGGKCWWSTMKAENLKAYERTNPKQRFVNLKILIFWPEGPCLFVECKPVLHLSLMIPNIWQGPRTVPFFFTGYSKL